MFYPVDFLKYFKSEDQKDVDSAEQNMQHDLLNSNPVIQGKSNSEENKVLLMGLAFPGNAVMYTSLF